MTSIGLPTSVGPAPAPNFFGMSRDRFRRHVQGLGVPAFRAEQVYSWVYQKHVRDPLGMTNLPLEFREALPGICGLELPETTSVHKSPDGNTHKFVLKLADGAKVESVSMRTPKRLTFCISSQVGCALGCAFCATGRLGLSRSLESWEMVAQYLAVRADSRRPITGAVFMGQGEPFHNYDAVIQAARVLSEPCGGRIAKEAITISTVGLVPQIKRYAEEGFTSIIHGKAKPNGEQNPVWTLAKQQRWASVPYGQSGQTYRAGVPLTDAQDSAFMKLGDDFLAWMINIQKDVIWGNLNYSVDNAVAAYAAFQDRKSTRLNSSHRT